MGKFGFPFWKPREEEVIYRRLDRRQSKTNLGLLVLAEKAENIEKRGKVPFEDTNHSAPTPPRSRCSSRKSSLPFFSPPSCMPPLLVRPTLLPRSAMTPADPWFRPACLRCLPRAVPVRFVSVKSTTSVVPIRPRRKAVVPCSHPFPPAVRTP